MSMGILKFIEDIFVNTKIKLIGFINVLYKITLFIKYCESSVKPRIQIELHG